MRDKMMDLKWIMNVPEMRRHFRKKLLKNIIEFQNIDQILDLAHAKLRINAKKTRTDRFVSEKVLFLFEKFVLDTPF